MMIGERIRHFRQIAGMKQYELATAIGRSPASICLYESGERANIPLSVLLEIARALNVSPTVFFAEEIPTHA